MKPQPRGFWHSAFYNAKTALALKSVEKDLTQFLSQSDYLNEGYKLKEAEIGILQKHYSEKLKKFESVSPHGKPEFKK